MADRDRNAASHVRWLDTLGNDDVELVGGKNASLGEMVRRLADAGVRVPDGFATTAGAYRAFLEENDLGGRIADLLADREAGSRTLAETGRALRGLFLDADLPTPIADAIREAYRELSRRYDSEAVDVAVRSSATAEDLPEASFAGQQESFLNVTGEEALLDACRRCFASLFTDRAIVYREKHGFDHMRVALSVGVQKMVRSDLAGAGVLFTIDTETGFPDVVLINASWGLGESVVKGTVNPDQYTVFKPLLGETGASPIIGKRRGAKETKLVYAGDGEADAGDADTGDGDGNADAAPAADGPGPEADGEGRDSGTREVETSGEERTAFVLTDSEILRLARWGVAIEEHYGRPMDIEWAKDGVSGDTSIVQARPETVQSRREAGALRTYRLQESGEVLVTGLAIGNEIASGRVVVLEGPEEADRFPDGAILVAPMTDPDWGPLMARAAGIVTDRGGRTSHAAIVSRELGVPAIVGTGNATETLEDGADVTLSCAEGDEGNVYRGTLDFEEEVLDLTDAPETETRIMLNIASPAGSMRWWRLPCRGVGLARMEYIINHEIRIHPMALVRLDEVEDREARRNIEELTVGFDDPTEYFVDRLSRGIAMLAAPHHPEPVIVRTSDFKTNEYAALIGGRQFEPAEENPMLGWRGAARYYSDDYRDGFALECRAIRRVREKMGFRNVIVMIPFCRTPEEADRVLEEMAGHGLVRGQKGLEVYVMAEIPTNILEAEAFAERFDGFSIGSNDLTQLVLGVDRDAARLAYLFDERRPAVKRLIRELIETAHAAGRPVGICGQAPSDHPEFAGFLVEAGIDSISLNPDSVLGALRRVARAEAARGEAADREEGETR